MRTLPRLFEDCVTRYSNNVFLLEKSNNNYKGTTFKEVQEKVHYFAAGLMQLGIKKGDRIALLSENRNDWVICELGIFFAGAVDVPLSVRLSEPADLIFRLNHSEAKYIIVSKNQAKKIFPLKQDLGALEKIILLDETEHNEDFVLYYHDIIESGREFLRKHAIQLQERWQSVTENDYANICYTSGTTADPKGIVLSHRNYTANIEQSLSLFTIPMFWTTLLILPWDHSFTHTCGIYTLMSCGASLASVQVGSTPMETLKNIPVNIKENRPYLLLSVPSLAKNFRKNIEKGIREKGQAAVKLFNAGLKIAHLYNGTGFNKGKGFRILLKLLNDIFDLIIFRKIRENFGGRLEYFIGGGALLDIDLQKFFYGIGIPMYQGYGLTEASPVISANTPARHKMGSSGTLVDNIDVKICDDEGREVPVGEPGEIVVKGENVMVGYWKNPQTTQETIRDGWLYTGDLGYFDRDGFLYVLGRFKSLLISDDGEKYSPESIEESIVQHSDFIDQCVLYNNQNAYTSALIYPDVASIMSYMKKHGIEANADMPGLIIQLISFQINQFLKGGKFDGMFPYRWLPASFALIDEGFTEENRLLNSTLKIVRPRILERYMERLNYMYTPQGKNIINETNISTLLKLLQ
ncbi:MAG: AMP-binding protein [Bacteroidales bacterium]|nr:AMP-binding protein [Bacteroidales bacterium]